MKRKIKISARKNNAFLSAVDIDVSLKLDTTEKPILGSVEGKVESIRNTLFQILRDYGFHVSEIKA